MSPVRGGDAIANTYTQERGSESSPFVKKERSGPGAPLPGGAGLSNRGFHTRILPGPGGTEAARVQASTKTHESVLED